MARRVVARSAEGSPGTALEAIDIGTAAYDQEDYTTAAAAFRTALKLPGAGVVRDKAKGAELTAAEEFCAWFNLAEALAASGGEQVVGEAYDAVEVRSAAKVGCSADVRTCSEHERHGVRGRESEGIRCNIAELAETSLLVG